MRRNEKDSEGEGQIIELYIITQTPMLQKYCVYNVMTIMYQTAKVMEENYRRQKKKKKNNKKIKREKKDYLYPISSRDFCLRIEHGIYLYVSCPSIDYYINPYCRRVAIVPCL
jgi:hypothetical protein